jgi:CDP-glucose 4,6-dehydratase
MHYLVTGHTGFKGAWLIGMLVAQGHQVSGISLAPEKNSLFEDACLDKEIKNDLRFDIRNASEVESTILSLQPDVVIHLAAQSLVRKSYVEPTFTFETNFNGTLNILNGVSKVESVKACLVVTTDKVYRNSNNKQPYQESDPLGGYDPYSASKSAADILTQSWISCFPSVPTAIARAGNVIGGGDWSKDRLVPDTINALKLEESITLRNPQSIRPWQHVLDCLNGYLKLVDSLLEGNKGKAFNFGPPTDSVMTVEEVVNQIILNWGNPDAKIKVENSSPGLIESECLLLDSTLSREKLGWTDLLSFEESMAWTTEWYLRRSQDESASDLLNEQIKRFNTLRDN